MKLDDVPRSNDFERHQINLVNDDVVNSDVRRALVGNVV